MPEDVHNSRLPDVSFIAGQRPRVSEGRSADAGSGGEIKSPDESFKELRDKAQYYIERHQTGLDCGPCQEARDRSVPMTKRFSLSMNIWTEEPSAGFILPSETYSMTRWLAHKTKFRTDAATR
jgi:hypothetical protein